MLIFFRVTATLKSAIFLPSNSCSQRVDVDVGRAARTLALRQVQRGSRRGGSAESSGAVGGSR